MVIFGDISVNRTLAAHHLGCLSRSEVLYSHFGQNKTHNNSSRHLIDNVWQGSVGVQKEGGGKSLMNIQTVIFRAKTNLTFRLENKGSDLFFQAVYLLDPPQSGLEGATSQKINVTVLP